jgi:hypothetical protein
MVDINQQILGLSLLTTQLALRGTIKELYRSKEPAGAKWLTDLENDLVSGLKDTVSEGVAMEDEIKVIDGAAATLEAFFKGLRNEIADESRQG